MPNYHYRDGITLTPDDIADVLSRYPHKFLWFAKNGYHPHYWQFLFHGNTDKETDRLCRFRHLVAGRRGGKTLSTAWEVIFYCLHPEAFHEDAHGKKSSEPLHVWIVTKDYPTGMAALLAVRKVLEQSGMEHGHQYKEHKGNRWFEFENGSFLQFKTADDPESLRGAGLDIMWYDESAFITDSRTWEVTRPALSDKPGLFVSSTTPSGKNWFYNEFWKPETLGLTSHGRVEYRSIDSPYFSKQEWDEVKSTYHPLLFKQEFMAAFDSMAGKELSGEWLHYYDLSEIDHLKRADGTYELSIYIAVDPAISLADNADRFAITALGVTKDRHQAYLLEQWAGRIPFTEQVDKIGEWFQKWRPNYIGIEKNAYQAALAQTVMRLEGMPPVVPMWARGKKFERILSMAPLFRIGRVRIRKDHIDFIDEWVDYDSSIRNPHDDCLDSMEMALRTAGILLPGSQNPSPGILVGGTRTTADWASIANERRPGNKNLDQIDEHLGEDW